MASSTSIFNTGLFRVATVGGAFVLGSCIWMEQRMQSTFRQQDFYQKPLIMLQKYKPAEFYLGRPIVGGRLDLGKKQNFSIVGVNAELSIPIRGPKNNGHLHVIASRENRDQEWSVDKLDIEIPSSHITWTFYDRSLPTAEEPHYPELTDSEGTSAHVQSTSEPPSESASKDGNLSASAKSDSGPALSQITSPKNDLTTKLLSFPDSKGISAS